MATYADWSDVEAGSDHEFTDDEIQRVEVLLDRAEQLLAVKVDLQYQLDNDLTTEAHIKTVLVNMVERRLADPGAVRSETVGPIQTVYTPTSGLLSGQFTVTRDDWQLLGSAAYGGLGTMPLSDPAIVVASWARWDTQERGSSGKLLAESITPELTN